MEKLNLTSEWDKVFPKSDRVGHRKVTVVSTMYDMSRVTAKGYFDQADSEEARHAQREALMRQRTEDFKEGSYPTGGGVVDPLPAAAPQFVKDYHAYYKTPRGYHGRSLNSNGGWAKSASTSLLNTRLLAYSNEIRGAVLVMHGEKAHSRCFGEDAFKAMTGGSGEKWAANKELLIVPGASHCDLYDGGEGNFIPWDRLAGFFAEHLK